MGKNNETAVSETIGFVLILGIVMTGIGLVTLYGYPILLEQQQNANVKNMEKNMIVLQNDVKLLAYKGVPYRETTMQISGGTLQVIRPNPPPFSTLPGGRSNFIITAAGLPPYGPYYTGLLQFNSTSDTNIIGLQNGAVVTNGFSQTVGPSAMLSEPRWFLDQTGSSRTLVISIVNMTSSNIVSTSSGIRTVQMNISSGDPVDQLLVPGTQVNVQYIDSGEGYRTAWKNYFLNTQVFPGCSVDEPNITLTVNPVDRLVIKTYNVTILNL